MKDQLLEIYNNTEIKHRPIKKPSNKFYVDFNQKAQVEIVGSFKDVYSVEFINRKTNSCLYASTITNNMWSACGRNYFIDWNIKITEHSDGNVVNINFDPKDKLIKIINQSPSLGDCLAWTPIVSEFQKQHSCKVDYYTPFSDLFKNQYDNINIFPYSESGKTGYYASYDLGYYIGEDSSKSPSDCREKNLQEVACEILGLKFKEIKTKLFVENKNRPIQERYVCISTSSTASCKHWHHENGWQKTVDYLNNLGYKVVVIQKEPLDYMDLKGLNNVIHPETKTLQEAMTWLYNCEFYMGLGSGISWLAWGLNKKVILISGFSMPFSEFFTPYRVINTQVCHGCWNDTNYKFNAGDWNWCPRNNDFICSKEISFNMVKHHINSCAASLRT